MIIQLSPQLRTDTLTLEKDGDALIFNGARVDLAAAPMENPGCLWIIGDVGRTEVGEIILTVVLPVTGDGTHGVAIPPALTVEEDGAVGL